MILSFERSAGRRSRYSASDATGAPPHARLDGNCGKRSHAIAASVLAISRPSVPEGVFVDVAICMSAANTHSIASAGNRRVRSVTR